MAERDDHPLSLELASLRASVAKFQQAAHQSGIQLQGSRLEFTLLSERVKAIEEDNTRLTKEADLLRANPPTQNPSADATALKQLTLAHRRLSCLLDAAEADFKTQMGERIDLEAVVARAEKERDALRAGQRKDREAVEALKEALDVERLARRKAEVDRDLCQTIIEEFKKQYPLASPQPTLPTTELHQQQQPPSPTAAPSSPNPPAAVQRPSTPPSPSLVPIPELLLGRPGLARLLADFHAETRSLSSQITLLTSQADDLQLLLSIEREASSTERALRASALADLARKTRDDKAASDVIERYMAFSQTSSLALHSSIENLRIRHSATVGTMTAQIAELQRKLGEERVRGEALLRSLGDLGAEVSRESAGRRREIALRLAALGREERILETLRRWQEKARTALQRHRRRTASVEEEQQPSPAAAADAKSPLSPTTSTTGNGVSPDDDPSTATVLALLEEATRLLYETPLGAEDLSPTASKVLLAEELVKGLVEELKQETNRRVALEKERRELLGDAAVDAEEEAAAAAAAAMNLPDEEMAATSELAEGESEEESEMPPPTPPPKSNGGAAVLPVQQQLPSDGSVTPPLTTHSPSIPPAASLLIDSLKTISMRNVPLQSAFLTLHSSLLSLISTLPPSTRHHGTYLSALERLDDIVEDARVELEIYVDDEVRTAQGFVVMLEGGLGGGKAVRDAEAFVEGKRALKVADVFRRRLEDVEWDLAAIKAAIHAPPTADEEEDDEPTSPTSSSSSVYASPLSSPLPLFPGGLGLGQPSSSFFFTRPHHQPRHRSSSYVNPLAALNLRNVMPQFTSPPAFSNHTAQAPLLQPEPSSFSFASPATAPPPPLSFKRASSASSITSAFGGRPTLANLGRLFDGAGSASASSRSPKAPSAATTPGANDPRRASECATPIASSSSLLLGGIGGGGGGLGLLNVNGLEAVGAVENGREGDEVE